MTVRHAATAAQIRAADPGISTWLSANAGSGKTRVLIQRVVRLLFAGTPPQRILCLTFTKAAAAEMQNRLFQLLGKWAMLDPTELLAALRELGVEDAIDQKDLRAARRLFAQAIEAPGGLRIQTIHSFCASLLRRFPLEARVSPNFVEIDETSTDMLRMGVLDAMADDADRPVIDALAMTYTSDDWAGLISAICRNRDFFSAEVAPDALRLRLGASPQDSVEELFRIALAHDGIVTISALIPILSQGAVTERRAAKCLERFDPDRPGHASLAALEDAFLTGAGAPKVGSLPNVSTQKGAASNLMPSLNAMMERVAEIRPRRLALAAADRTAVLYRFARSFLARYDAAKSARGWLDFDDLIHRAGALLSDHSVAQWVLYRLDGGIDHILVDEAQDTSPGQWTVIERLADEFAVSQGSRNEERTVFVVGDQKQSIYGFQGADLATFARMESHFQSRYAPREAWQVVKLEHSFRSSPAILRVVDATFDDRINAGLGGTPTHLAFFEDLPGRVDVWPVIAEEDGDTQVGAFSAEFSPAVQKPQHRLAVQIAAQVRAMIDAGTPVRDGETWRPAHEGDILILVRQRKSVLFNAIIRACKAAKLEVAGADRLKLAAEIAVRDLISLLRFLSLPEDDLSLAEVLRSPLFGWREQDLFSVAAHRPEKGFLWAALRHAKTAYADTVLVLDDLRMQAEFLRPYDLIERALTRHEMRRRLLERLGPEAEDGIDELLTQALLYEQTDVPSLTGFLLRLDAAEGDIKRQTQQGARAIRVMTVHGAKGLEAPIVILPDATMPVQRQRSEIVPTGDGIAFLQTAKDVTPPVMTTLKDAAAAKDEEERMRLLYVAMTRAETWLIVAAAGKVKDNDAGWYTLVRQGAERAGGAMVAVDGVGPVLRVEFGRWPVVGRAAVAVTSEGADRPSWLHGAAPATAKAQKPMSPSGLPGAKALPGELGLDDRATDQDAALRFGTRLHLLLQHLPDWPVEAQSGMARDLLASVDPPADEAEIATLTAHALRILGAPDLRAVFAAPSLAEVEVTGSLAEMPGVQFHGTIDRLIVMTDRVIAIDYKSNAVVPADAAAVPAGILRQMHVYCALLEAIYPDRAVEAVIIWTANARLMPLPRDMLRSALGSDPIP